MARTHRHYPAWTPSVFRRVARGTGRSGIRVPMSIIEIDADGRAGKRPTTRSPKRRQEHGTVPAVRARTDVRVRNRLVVLRTLKSIARDWRLIATLAAVAVALAALSIPWIPRKYSATALVYPTLFSSEADRRVPMGTIDAASLVASEARLIVSDPILRAAIHRLAATREAGWDARSWSFAITDWLRATFLPETRSGSPLEREVSRLRNRIEVVKDTRSYLISISMTARTADEAVALVNAIALEYFLDKRRARAQSAVASAHAELVRQLALHGEKHPKVRQGEDALEAARADLAAVASAVKGSDGPPLAREGITFAIANQIPTSPKGGVILGLSALAGLLLGIGLAAWRDRFGFDPQRFLVLARSHAREGGKQVRRRLEWRWLRFRDITLPDLRDGLVAFRERVATLVALGLARVGHRAPPADHVPSIPDRSL